MRSKILSSNVSNKNDNHYDLLCPFDGCTLQTCHINAYQPYQPYLQMLIKHSYTSPDKDIDMKIFINYCFTPIPNATHSITFIFP
jgi:hypothetical protein